MAHSARRPRHKYAAVSLSPSCLHRLRLPAEFAARLEPGAGEEEREVIVMGPLGKVWRVELRWQDGVCWLGSGWPELAAALGIGAGWSVQLRRGVATLSAFDPGCCLARLCTPHAGVMSKHRHRFIKLLQPDDLEKMRIPDKFVQQHLTEAGSCLSSQNATIVCPLRKFWYVGNMVLSVEVFLRNGRLKEYHTTLSLCTTDGARGASATFPQRPTAPSVSKKRKNDKHVVYAISAPTQSKSKPAAISPRHSFTKKITSFALKKHFRMAGSFCSSIGLLGACTIELKTSMRSWPVAFNITKTYGYIKGKGWKRFCQDNEVEEGDMCTFKVVEKRVWLVVIK